LFNAPKPNAVSKYLFDKATSSADHCSCPQTASRGSSPHRGHSPSPLSWTHGQFRRSNRNRHGCAHSDFAGSAAARALSHGSARWRARLPAFAALPWRAFATMAYARYSFPMTCTSLPLTPTVYVATARHFGHLNSIRWSSGGCRSGHSRRSAHGGASVRPAS